MEELIGGTGSDRSLSAPAAPVPGRWSHRWRLAAGLAAGLLAAVHGLGAAAGLAVPGPPAPELQGPLALALVLAAVAGLDWPGPGAGATAAGLRGRRSLRWLASLALVWAAAVQLGPWALAGPTPVTALGPVPSGPLTMAGLLLALATLGALLWWPARPRSDRGAVAAAVSLALLWALCAAQLCLLLPARLLLDWLPLAGGLSWPGTLALALLAAAANLRLRAHPAWRAFLADREDRRIFCAQLAMLFGAVMLATLLIAALLALRTVQELSPPLLRGARAQAGVVAQLLGRLAEAAEKTALAWPAADAADAQAARQVLQGLHEQLEPLGPVVVTLGGAAAAPLEAGRLDEARAAQWLALPMPMPTAAGAGAGVGAGVDAARLAVGRGEGQLLLQVLQPLPPSPARPGEARWLRVQLRPLQPQAQLMPADLGGAGATLLLCVPAAAQADCLAADGAPVFRMPLAAPAGAAPWPIQRAWRGEAGALLLRDPWGVAAVVAHAPVGNSGLGLLHKLPVAPLLQRLADAALPALGVVLAVMAACAGLQLRRSFPRLRTLRHAKALLELVLQSLPVGVWIADRRGRIVATNPAVAELWGGAPQLHEGRPVGRRARRVADGRVIGPEDYPMLRAVRSGQASAHELIEVERPDGSRRTIMNSALPLVDADGAIQGAISVDEDLTEMRRAQQALEQSQARLRALSANEEALIEEERKHIAREVHDELGQALTALKMSLALLQRQFGGSQPALDAQLGHIAGMLDGTLDVVRHVASNLRPAALDFGLAAALEWLAEDFGHRWELPCELQLPAGEIALDEARAVALFRIVQESLTNVARHARAQRVRIRLRRGRSRLRLSVGDDGVGFDATQEPGGHFGLLGMRERALKIGASLRVRSRPGEGTTIVLDLPFGTPL